MVSESSIRNNHFPTPNDGMGSPHRSRATAFTVTKYEAMTTAANVANSAGVTYSQHTNRYYVIAVTPLSGGGEGQ